MTAGMAEVIAAHTQLEWESETGRSFCECGVKLCTMSTPINTQHRKLYAHVADELAKAGYGLVPDVAPEYGAQMMTHGGRGGMPFGHGPVRNPNWWNKSTHMRLVGPWQELEPLPDALTQEPQHG